MSSIEWQPPSLTEEERLAIQARQKDRELLSNAMGQYLLKGYRMLGTNCEQCGNILLRSPKEETEYCIYCQELHKQKTTKKSPTSCKTDLSPEKLTQPMEESTKIQSTPSTPADQIQLLAHSQEAIMLKIKWATEELTRTTSVEYSAQLCVLIQSAAQALGKLKEFVNS